MEAKRCTDLRGDGRAIESHDPRTLPGIPAFLAGFLGWLRGERGHCSMARVPTIAEEDAKRPNRERDCLVGERTRIVNRIKSTLARWAFATSNQPCARRPSVWQPCTSRRACRCRQTPWPSCSVTWPGSALLSARLERSRKLARND